MIELRPVRIILISFYCFLVGLFLFSVTANTIFSSNPAFDPISCLPIGAAIILAFALFFTGVGILYYNQLCWKILFFLLIIFISNVVSFAFVFLISLCFNLRSLYSYYKDVHIAAVTWVSFLAIFIFGIIVLYHLTRKEVVNHFGEMEELIEPF